jgi:two-component system, NtrC family, nitrogen regulation response regulator NtrX
MRILLAEDDDATRKGILMFLRGEGYEVTPASGGLEALSCLGRERFDFIISDIRMPGMDGLALLERLRADALQIPVIMMTAFATVEQAVKALQSGADDYLVKPLNLDELLMRIRRIEAKLSLIRENRNLKDRLQRLESPRMVGAGKSIQEVHKAIARLGDDPDVPVVIYGESGTGKELVARQIHSQSLRSERPFVDISCAALSDELLESELFGHKKGAFTGAYRDKQGLLQAAHRGTLFLDEVSEMSLRMQSRLLRFLQEHTVLPVGATSTTAVDTRVLGASNKKLQDLVKEGKFREDLYYRLNVVEIHLPPLRERTEDIPLLVRHFIEKYAGNRTPKQLSHEAFSCLEKYPWPGNVRELENMIRALLVQCEADEVSLGDLPARVRQAEENRVRTGDWSGLTYPAALRAVVADFEEGFLRHHLTKNHGNITKTADSIGLSRVALHKKIKQYFIE